MHNECEGLIYIADSFRGVTPETCVMKYYQIAPNTPFKINRLVPCIVIHFFVLLLIFSFKYLCLCTLLMTLCCEKKRYMYSLHCTETLVWDLKWVVRHEQTFWCSAILKAWVIFIQNLSETLHLLAELQDKIKQLSLLFCLRGEEALQTGNRFSCCFFFF